MIKQIGAHLAAGEEVKPSSFGSVRLHDKATRMGRNPKTREAMSISSRRVAVFKASQKLEKRIGETMGGNRSGR